MYKKYLIVASKLDKAGINITTQLSQFRKNPVLIGMSDQAGFDFYLVDDEIIHSRNLNPDKIKHYDFVIFASRHKSTSNEKTLSVHAPGNWRTADFGGRAGEVCRTSALFLKQVFEILKKNADESGITKEYKVTLECTHHGPLIDKPCIFIEIGSTENEWVDRRAGFVIAKTIRDIIKEFKNNPYNEVAIGIGGPHYCPNFNKIQLNSNFALSHIIPQYVLPLKEPWILEAIDKTEEEVDFVVLDWKGLGGAEERERIINILDKLHVNYKKTSKIDK